MASIKIPIGTDNTGLDAGTARAEKRMNKFKGNMVRTFAAIAASVGIVGILDKLSERLDRIGKLSRRGLDTDFLQKLDLLAEMSGTNLESAAKGISMFIKEVRAADGPTTKVAANIEALGLNLDDLKKLNSQELFVAIASAIGNLDDESDQIAATTGLMGTRYADMLPLIQDLAHKGMPELAGATRDQIRSVEESNDAWTKTKVMLELKLAPVLVFIGKLVRNFARGIEAITTHLMNFTGLVINHAYSVKQALEGMFTLDPNKIKAGLQGVKDGVRQFAKDTKKELKDSFADAKEIWMPEIKEGGVTGSNKFTPVVDDPKETAEEKKARRAAEKAEADRLKKITAKNKKLESNRQSSIKDLEKEKQGVMDDIASRIRRQDDPGSITASSMRAIGGGGGVALPNEQKVLRVNQQQLKKLGEIEQLLKQLNSPSRISKEFR